MAEMPLDQAIPRFKTNEDRIDTFVNGDENATYTTSGGVQVPSVRKVVADFEEQGDGLLAQAEAARDAAQTAAAALGLITLVYAGDSIAASSTSGLTVRLDESVGEFNPRLSLATVVNTAVGGSRLDSTLVGLAANPVDLVQRYATHVYPHRPAATGHAQAILIISVGANDFGPAAANDTVRQAWIDAYTAYVDQAVSDGFTVVGMTIMRRLMQEYDQTATTKTRLVWNDAIRRCKALSGVVDLAEFFDPEADAALFIDNTHPGDAGIPIMAGMVSRQIDALGQESKYDLPPATGAVTLPAATISELERAAITFDNHTGTPQVLTSALTTAIGTGDFTFSAWVYPRADDTGTKVILSDATASITFSAVTESTGFVRPVMVGANVGAGNLAPVGRWAHLVARRESGVLTYWVNGKPVHWYVGSTITRSVAYTTSLGAMVQINRGATSGKFARIRQWSRALTDAEIAADYAALSPLWDDAALFSALADGSDCIWPQFADLIGPDFVALNTYPKIPRPAQSAVRRFTTTGNATVLICPQGHTIERWIAKITAAGGGNVDIGLKNNGGELFDAAPLSVGEHDLALLTRTMTNSNGAAYINAAGYTIEHVIRVSA